MIERALPYLVEQYGDHQQTITLLSWPYAGARLATFARGAVLELGSGLFALPLILGMSTQE